MSRLTDEQVSDSFLKGIANKDGSTIRIHLEYPTVKEMAQELLELRRENERLKAKVKMIDDFAGQMDLCKDCKDKWRVKRLFKFLSRGHWPIDSGSGRDET